MEAWLRFLVRLGLDGFVQLSGAIARDGRHGAVTVDALQHRVHVDPGLGSGVGDVNNFPFNFPAPYVVQWNFNIERQLGGDIVAQVGYTGSEAHKLPGIVNLNQPFPGTGNVSARRPYQGYANIQSYNPYINSKYNALLAKLERRFAKGMTMLASYTYGHSLDGGANNNDADDPGPQDVRNVSAQKGSSNFDVRNSMI